MRRLLVKMKKRRRQLYSPANMIMLSWNYQRYGNPQTFQHHYLLVKDKKPALVFVMLTKIKASKFEFLKRKLCYDGCFTVDPVGIGGGLVLLWKPEMSVDICDCSQRRISAWIKGDRSGKGGGSSQAFIANLSLANKGRHGNSCLHSSLQTNKHCA